MFAAGHGPRMSATYDNLLRVFGDEWFSSFDPESQKLLLTQGRSRHIRRGQFIVRRGDAASGIFGVVSGVLAASSLLHDGRQIIFGLLESGDWCGEASSIDGLARTHNIHALHDSELLHIATPVFEKAMSDARFARAIAILQTARIRAMFSFFEDAALRGTRARIARRLLRLAHGDARAHPRERREIRITHETLSMMLGVTRQTLSLELKALAASGAISLSYGRVVIESEQVLSELGDA
jgi:CRP-like cAMP-binding protein